MSSLQKLAALHNIAVVLLNQSVTKIQSGAGAILVSAISSTAWDAGLATSITLFRDWGWEGKQVRYARVLKADGIGLGGKGGFGKVLAFIIESVWPYFAPGSLIHIEESANERTARSRGGTACRY